MARPPSGTARSGSRSMVDWSKVPPPPSTGVDWSSVPPPTKAELAGPINTTLSPSEAADFFSADPQQRDQMVRAKFDGLLEQYPDHAIELDTLTGDPRDAALGVKVDGHNIYSRSNIIEHLKAEARAQADQAEPAPPSVRAAYSLPTTTAGKRQALKKHFGGVLRTAEGPLVYDEKKKTWRMLDDPKADMSQAASWFRVLAAPAVGPLVAAGDAVVTMHPETAGDLADLSGEAIEALPDVAVAMLTRKLPWYKALGLEGLGGAGGVALRKAIAGEDVLTAESALRMVTGAAAAMAPTTILEAAPWALKKAGVLGAEERLAKSMVGPDTAATKKAVERGRQLAGEVGEDLTAGELAATVDRQGRRLSGGNFEQAVGEELAPQLRLHAQKQAAALEQYLAEAPGGKKVQKLLDQARNKQGEMTLPGVVKALGSVQDFAKATGASPEAVRRLKIGLEYAQRTQVPPGAIPKSGLAGEVLEVVPKAGKRLSDLILERAKTPEGLVSYMLDPKKRDALLSVLDAAKPRGTPEALQRALSHFSAATAQDVLGSPEMTLTEEELDARLRRGY